MPWTNDFCLHLAIASAIGLTVFSLGTLALRIPEATLLVNRVRSRFTRR